MLRLEALPKNILHLPGLRGNPSRTYPATFASGAIACLYSEYVASIVARWELEGDARLDELGHWLLRLCLTWKVSTSRIDDTRVELRVGRLPRSTKGGSMDQVNIADVRDDLAGGTEAGGAGQPEA